MMRKVYYDLLANNINIEGIGRFFASGSLEAIADGDNVFAQYKGTPVKEFYEHFSDILKQDGSPAGTTVIEVVNYLNNEFNQVISGTGGVTETTASIQAKRPIKTVNSQSLEGVGNIVVSGGKPSLTLVKANATLTTETVVARWEIPANSITALSSILTNVRMQSGGTGTFIFRLRVGATGTITDTLLAQCATSAAQVANSQGSNQFLIEFPTTTSAIGSGFTIMQNAVLGTTTGAGATATIVPLSPVFISVTVQCSVAQANITKACSAMWNN